MAVDITPRDALQILVDVEQARWNDAIPVRSEKLGRRQAHRDEIIEKLRPLARRAELVHDKK